MTDENGTVRLDIAAKDKGLTALGLAKKLNPKDVFVTRAALDSVDVRTRGRTPDKWIDSAMAVFGISKADAQAAYIEWRKLNPAPDRKK